MQETAPTLFHSIAGDPEAARLILEGIDFKLARMAADDPNRERFETCRDVLERMILSRAEVDGILPSGL